jgi:hypothetical protein
MSIEINLPVPEESSTLSIHGDNICKRGIEGN